MTVFPAFILADCELIFVDQFKYLGHVIDNKLVDDKDISKELKSLFMRTNMWYRRFNRCICASESQIISVILYLFL